MSSNDVITGKHKLEENESIKTDGATLVHLYIWPSSGYLSAQGKENDKYTNLYPKSLFNDYSLFSFCLNIFFSKKKKKG